MRKNQFRKIMFSLFFSASASAADYSIKDLERHSTVKDCWLAIDNKVYDVSQYIAKHPAPQEALAKYCGKVADAGWKTKDRGHPHSRSAERLLKRYEIGFLK